MVLDPKSGTKHNILALGAHPDDIELGAFGSLIKWSQNSSITMLVATNGEAGASDGTDRVDEARKSAESINAKIVFLALRDGFLAHDLTMVNTIEGMIKETAADLILVNHPNDLHQDHRNLALASLSAARRAKRVLLYETPSTTRDFTPNFYVEIREQLEQKCQALCNHRSQLNKQYMDQDSVYSVAAHHALNINRPGRFYEAFEVFRYVVD